MLPDVPLDGLEGALPEGLVGFFWFVVLPGAVEPEDAELPPVAP